MSERFESAKVSVVQNIPLLLFGGDCTDPIAQSAYLDAISVANDFAWRGTLEILSEGLEQIGKLQIELNHSANDDHVSLKILSLQNLPFRYNFRSMEGMFKLTKQDDAFISTRIQIMDVNTCNNFGCICDRKQLCYKVKPFCRLTDIARYVIENSTGLACLTVVFAGRTSSYRKSKSGPNQEIPSFHFHYAADILPDFLIRVAGKEYPVHKAILAGQSDVFLAMFTIRSNETKKGVIEMKDSTPDGVKGLLDFLYKREIQIPNKDNIETVYEMLRIAEKYNIQTLTEAIVQIICLVSKEDFDLDHAIQFFTFSQRLQSRILEIKSFQIFQTKRKEILNSKSVTAFFKESTELAEKLLTSCLNSTFDFWI